jgi:hypothetical protein
MNTKLYMFLLEENLILHGSNKITPAEEISGSLLEGVRR